jgi:hypothetical protein
MSTEQGIPQSHDLPTEEWCGHLAAELAALRDGEAEQESILAKAEELEWHLGRSGVRGAGHSPAVQP